MVCILLADGFEESEALITADLLRRAGIEVVLTGVAGNSVKSSHGVTVIPDRQLAEIDVNTLDMLILPGGLGGVDGIRSSEAAGSLIRACYDKGIYLAAICAAPTILAEMGILGKRKAVCYPGMEDQMGEADYQHQAPFVVDGKIITGEACGSTFLFAFKLIELLTDEKKARQVRNAIVFRG